LLVKTTYFIKVLPKHYAHRAYAFTVIGVLTTNTFYDAIWIYSYILDFS